MHQLNIPGYVNWIFICTTILTLLFLLAATIQHEMSKSLIIAVVSLAILCATGILAKKGFFLETKGIPPRLMLGILPSILIIIGLFLFPSGKKFIDRLSPVTLTWLHVVRVPLELVLFWLCAAKAIPQLMTFEGRNFDILAGVTAPFIAWLMSKNKISRGSLIVWNLFCLGLLMNIVVNASLSAPFSFQQFALDQPNVAVLYFPYVWLPCFIVPAVLFAHLVTLRQLIIKKNING